MTMHRRDFLKTGIAVSIAAGLPPGASAQTAFAPKPGAWRNFEIVTRLALANASGASRAWVPVPAVHEADWFRSLGNTWSTNGKAELVHDGNSGGATFVHVEWTEGEQAPVVDIVSRITTRDRAVDLGHPGKASPLSAAERARYTAGTDLIPIDGIVKETSDKITAGTAGEIEKARAIYQWVVDNTFRDAKVRGCGIGDIASMLKTGNLGGKCADLNALYVGLARAAGLPARDVYGIRVAPSRFGYKSLGANSDVITKAQHCRAEVYLSGFGWVPVDPADVRKVVLEEPPTNLAISDPKVVAARATLFGAWETNWLAYNFAHDVALPGSRGPKLGFLMYPQAETADMRLDCLDPDTFKYTITSKELTGA
jgi:transglutaminase-like putative cysteine protease